MNSAMIVIAVVIAGIGTADDLKMDRTGQILLNGGEHVEAELKHFVDSVANRQTVRMLVAPQSVHRIVGWDNVDLMTTQFLDFPLDVNHPFAAITTQHVRYVEILASGPAWWYSPESVRLREYAEQNGTVAFYSSGYFLEAGRRYDAPLTAPADTLLVYELHTSSDSAVTNVKSVYLHSISLRTNRLDQKAETQ